MITSLTPTNSPMHRFYSQLLTLVVIVCLFLSLFVFGYVKYLLGFEGKDSINGEWIGVVQIESIRKSAHHGDAPSRESQGDGAMRIKVRPASFSFLSRTHVEAEITDQQGIVKTFDVQDLYKGWYLKWGGTSGRLISKADDDALQGKWNGSFTPFELSFAPSLGYPMKYRIDSDLRYQIAGVLNRGDDSKYTELCKQVRLAKDEPSSKSSQ